jgi:hypothetical protein
MITGPQPASAVVWLLDMYGKAAPHLKLLARLVRPGAVFALFNLTFAWGSLIGGEMVSGVDEWLMLQGCSWCRAVA